MKIIVTQEDINKGCKEDGNNCPIALAICRVLPGKYIHVDFDNVCIKDSENQISERAYKLPAEAHYFIDEFDNEGQVEPLEFDIEGLEVEAAPDKHFESAAILLSCMAIGALLIAGNLICKLF